MENNKQSDPPTRYRAQENSEAHHTWDIYYRREHYCITASVHVVSALAAFKRLVVSLLQYKTSRLLVRRSHPFLQKVVNNLRALTVADEVRADTPPAAFAHIVQDRHHCAELQLLALCKTKRRYRIVKISIFTAYFSKLYSLFY